MKKVVFVLVSIFIMFVVHPWMYADVFNYMKETEFEFVFQLAAFITLIPIINMVTDYILTKKLQMGVIELYAIIIYLYNFISLAAFDNLAFYGVREVTKSALTAIWFLLLCVSIVFGTCYFLVHRYQIPYRNNFISALDLKVLEPYKIYFDFFIFLPRITLAAGLYNINLMQFLVVSEFLGYVWCFIMILYGTWPRKILGVLYLALVSVSVLTTTLLAPIISIFVAFILIYSDKKKHPPYVAMVLGLPSLFILLAVKYVVRTISWGKGGGGISLGIWKSVLTKALSNSSSIDTDMAFKQIAYRISHFEYLMHGTDAVPMRKPFWGLHSYSFLFNKLIPRLFWPGKAFDSTSNEVGHYLGIAQKGDEATSFNIPYIVEAYISFGYAGALVLFVHGTILFYCCKLIYKPSSAFEKLFGLFLFMLALRIDNHLALHYGNLHFQGLFIYCIYRAIQLVQGNRKRATYSLY